MRIKFLLTLVGVASALLLTPLGPAQAQRPGLYFGGAYGLYDIKEVALDEQDSFWKAFLGAQITDWLGIEASWIDFNRASNQGSTFETDGITAAAVLSLPVGPKSAVYAKAGQYWWDAQSNFAGVASDTDGDDGFFGAGFKFGFTDSVGLRVEYERYKVAAMDLDTASVGLQVTF
jgi:OmpA-OmpF porin, OOP family